MPEKSVSILLVPVVMAVLIAGVLSGCGPATGKHLDATQSTTPSSDNSSANSDTTPTKAPTKPWPPPLPANALFQISATVTAPGGAAADLLQTVFLPTPLTAQQKSQLTSHCGGQDIGDVNSTWKDNYATATGMTSTITATLHPGSPDWDNNENAVYAGYMGFADFTGAYGVYQAYCAPGFITIPGSQQALAPIQASDPPGQPLGWAGESAGYGFYGGGNDPDESDIAGLAVVSNCVVQLSATAAANPTAAAWATRASKLIDGCDYRGADRQ